MFNFVKYRWVYYLISASVLLVGMYHLLRFGLRPAIDFTGGTLYEVRLSQSVETEDLRATIETDEVHVGSVQTSGNNQYVVKLNALDASQSASMTTLLNEKYGSASALRTETVGPILGQELLQKTLVAALIAVVIILSYVAWAFKNVKFGVSAIVALIHDVLVVVGVFAILGVYRGIEVDALFVTALLTTMSFSVHDTIVVFDRIRELRKKQGSLPLESQINLALTETMGRSLNNSLTIIFMLLALFLLGGDTVRWFVFALLIGTISGTYSSPFVATPVMYELSKRLKK
ncbi:protein translocase subunit SecF [Candidatus Microgenomates bacterium]|nr:MAG: protein translocase subunit SecF [Candidatus Microgenomates bacterium]